MASRTSVWNRLRGIKIGSPIGEPMNMEAFVFSLQYDYYFVEVVHVRHSQAMLSSALT